MAALAQALSQRASRHQRCRRRAGRFLPALNTCSSAACLTVQLKTTDGQNIYACKTCPYVYYIDREISKSVPLKRKEVEPVLGGEEEWKNAPRTEARCPDCSYHTALLQGSADPVCGRACNPLLPLRELRLQLAGGLAYLCLQSVTSSTRPPAAVVQHRTMQAAAARVVLLRPAPGSAQHRTPVQHAAPARLQRRRRGGVVPVAQWQGAAPGSAQKTAEALAQLEVLKREAAASQQLRAELEARTAAMQNLQRQLQQLEELREAEAEAAAARYAEFEAALALAERSMDGGESASQAAAVRAQLEAQLDAKATELSTAQRQLAALQQQLLSQRSAGSSAAAAEVEQLRRQLAMERQRREDAEQAAAYAGQAGENEVAALEEQASLLREQVDLLKAQLSRKDGDLAQQAQQLSQQAQQLQAARREAAAADERMQQLKQAVAAEAVAAAEVLDKAEQAAQMLGQQLLSMMQSRQGDESESEEEEEEEAGVLRTAQGDRLNQEDADALFEELEFLQQQVAAKQAAAEDALNRAEAAEAEASSLRERLINAAAVPPPVAATGYSASLEKELAAAQSAAAAAEAEAQAVASQNAALQDEVSRLRQSLQAASAAAGSAAKPKGFGAGARDGGELAAALARVSDLERQCAELRDAATRKDAVLAKSRKFIESYLSRSSVQRMTRGAAAAGSDGAGSDEQ